MTTKPARFRALIDEAIDCIRTDRSLSPMAAWTKACMANPKNPFAQPGHAAFTAVMLATDTARRQMLFRVNELSYQDKISVLRKGRPS